MVLLSYHRVRLQIAAVIFSFSAMGVVVRYWATAHLQPWGRRQLLAMDQLEFVYALIFLVTAAFVGRLLYLMCGDLAAIRTQPEGLEVTGLLGRRLVPWDGLLGGHRVNYGTFVNRNRWFNVRFMEDGAYRSKRIPLILTKRPSGGQMSLPEKIDRAREEAMGRKYLPNGERIEGTGFDPDAAIERYLKTKADGRAADPAPADVQPARHVPARPLARPAFGRKGL